MVDDLRSPRNLADRAQQLGMVPAKSMAFVRLSDGSIIGVAQPAKDDQRLNVVTTRWRRRRHRLRRPRRTRPRPPATPATAPTPTPTP